MADELEPFIQKARLGKGTNISFAVISVAVASLGFFDDSASMGQRVGLTISFVLIALFFLALAFRSPAKHPFVVALRERRNDIAWIYLTRHNVNFFHANTSLNIGLIDGKQRALGIGKAGEEEMLARALALAPRATVGHSRELAAQFKRDPRSLQRATP